MDDDREVYEFSYALYLARQVDREAAQMIVQAAEAGLRSFACHSTQIELEQSNGEPKRAISMPFQLNKAVIAQ